MKRQLKRILDNTSSRVQALGRKALAFQVDVSSWEQVRDGGYRHKIPVHKIDPAQWG